MKNLVSFIRLRLWYSRVREEDDRVSLSNSEPMEYPTEKKRSIALGAISICQIFHWATFSIITVWIPQSLALNTAFFNRDVMLDLNEYNEYTRKYVTLLCIMYMCSCRV